MRILLLIPWSLAVMVVLLTGHTYILPYALVLGLFLVILGRLPGYSHHPARRTYDLLFVTYLWAIVAVRCRPFRWSVPVELALNIAEHIGFALVIGLLAYLIFLLLFRWQARHSLIAAVISFNVLGIGNELFQDIVFGGSLQPFDMDAWKDIGMNAAGSVLLYFIINRSNDPITPAPASGT